MNCNRQNKHELDQHNNVGGNSNCRQCDLVRGQRHTATTEPENVVRSNACDMLKHVRQMTELDHWLDDRIYRFFSTPPTSVLSECPQKSMSERNIMAGFGKITFNRGRNCELTCFLSLTVKGIKVVFCRLPHERPKGTTLYYHIVGIHSFRFDEGAHNQLPFAFQFEIARMEGGQLERHWSKSKLGIRWKQATRRFRGEREAER